MPPTILWVILPAPINAILRGDVVMLVLLLFMSWQSFRVADQKRLCQCVPWLRHAQRQLASHYSCPLIKYLFVYIGLATQKTTVAWRQSLRHRRLGLHARWEWSLNHAAITAVT